MNVKKLLEIIRVMILRAMLRMRLGIWLLGWRIDKVIRNLRNKSRLMNTILSRYDARNVKAIRTGIGRKQ